MLRFLRIVWAQIALAMIVGLFLVTLSLPSHQTQSILEHIGIGLIVAAIVTAFWQLREISDFFVSLSRQTLIEHDYVKTLNLPSLRKLRSTAATAIFSQLVDNKTYESAGVESLADEILHTQLAPGEAPLSGIYRDDYVENIVLESISTEEAIKELGSSASMSTTVEKPLTVLKETSTYEYRVVAPRLDHPYYREYTVECSGRSADMPLAPLDKCLTLRVGPSRDEAKLVPLSFKNDPDGGYHFEGKVAMPFRNGEVRVWSQLVDYRIEERQPFVFHSMVHLTHKARVHIQVTSQQHCLAFDGDWFGVSGVGEKRYFPNGIELTYSGWLLENHGYFIWWWRAPERVAPGAPTLTTT
jgi:hypothetical protein